MKSRFLIVILSLIFAVVATFGVGYYVIKVKASVVEGQELVEVVVAKKGIQAGTSIAEMVATGAIAVEKVPKQYVAEGALMSTDEYSTRAIASDLAKGEQLTALKLKKDDESGLTYRIPDGMLAVSIAVDEVTGVGGKLRPGDKIDIFATFSPGPGDTDMTKVMLQNIEIIATSDSGTGEKDPALMGAQRTGPGKKVITLAVLPGHAEKLVFASEKGHVWLGLRKANSDKQVQTSGQTITTVFK